MRRLAAMAAVLSAAAIFFLSCGDPIKPGDREDFFEDIALSVRETTVDSITVNGIKFYNKKAFLVRVTENEPWNPATGAPVFYSIFKVYAPGDSVFAVRIFGGGGGYASGTGTVYYVENTGETDTVPYNLSGPSVERLVIIGTEEKRRFQFGCAATTGAVSLGGSRYTGGFENTIIRDNDWRLGGVSRYFYLNNNKQTTAIPRVIMSARFDTSGAGVLYLYRHSSIQTPDFSGIASIDSLLKAATPADTQYVRINGENRIRLSDSVILDNRGIYAGKYGGRDTIRLNALASYFDEVDSGGEAGWITVKKAVTLPLGYGLKAVYLASPTWKTPLYDDIEIQPFQGEIALDMDRASIRLNELAKKACLLSDQVPFVFRTFGDTTYDAEITVWLATRNLKNAFMVGDQLTDFFIEANEVEFKVQWPDAILETPPRTFPLSSGSDTKGTLDPDYENGYRISPLAHLYHDGSDAKFQYATNARDNMPNYIYRQNNPFFLSVSVTPGSILGYSEKNLNNFSGQDSLLNYDPSKKEKYRTPSTGWFRFVPLDLVSPDHSYNPDNLSAYFGGLPPASLIPPENGYGNKYFSIFSAFTYSADSTYDDYWWANAMSVLYIPGVGGPRLYRNPFRSLPFHFPTSASGSKEFVLIAYAKGKHFKEPRIFISSFTSPYRYVWDKIAPHISWALSTSPTSEFYAPMYYVDPVDKRVLGTDLGKTLIPNVFDVCVSTQDLGFGRITSVKLCFNYAGDYISMDPVTGLRRYSKETIVAAELSVQELSAFPYGTSIAFRGINAVLWQKGIWDMWIETSDDLGNKGIAPYANDNGTYGRSLGFTGVRQIEIK